MLNLLFLDDDEALLKQLESEFLNAYNVFTATNIAAAQKISAQNQIHLFIVDVLLGNENGYEFVDALKKDTDTPVIMLTSLSEERNVLSGFGHGADDYITKPFKMSILSARIASKLKKTACTLLCEGDFVLDKSFNKVTYKNKTVEITSTEFNLLFFLAKNSGVPYGSDVLFKSVWNCDSVLQEADRHIVQVHIASLRKKLLNATGKNHIQAIWKKGYYFTPEGN